MAKASTIIKKAVSYLGTKENPANSNKVKFNNDYLWKSGIWIKLSLVLYICMGYF